MNWWEWLLTGLVPLPGYMVWRWRCRRADARKLAQLMEQRRQAFGGFVSVPRGPDGKPGVIPVDRP